MKDRFIFLISLILVVFGIIYLGYTAFKFFTRKENTNEIINPTVSGVSDEKKDVFSVNGNANKDILSEGLNSGDQVSLTIDLQNPTADRASYTYEGRVYKVEGLYTFPNVDSQIPVDVFEFPVTLDANTNSEYVYPYTVTDCGDYFMSIASEDYWKQGKGNMSYGYFNVACSDAPATNQNKGGLDQTNTNRKQSPLADKVLGKTTKGGLPVNQNEKINELPKAGPSDTAVVLGIVLLGLGTAYRLNLGKSLSN